MSVYDEIEQGKRCPYCGRLTILMDTQHIYNSKESYGMAWACMPCSAWVCCHKDTSKAMGRLATKELRDLRHTAHLVLDPLWLHKVATQGVSVKEARDAANNWLANELGIKVNKCHIGLFDELQCKEVIRICTPIFKHIKEKQLTDEQ